MTELEKRAPRQQPRSRPIVRCAWPGCGRKFHLPQGQQAETPLLCVGCIAEGREL
jgi:hypothetical protein